MRRAGSSRSIQAEEYELELGGHIVYPGGKVNVRWKGTWYNGIVSKIGPQQPMCRVREMSSNQTLLLDHDELKLMESFVLQKQYSPGTRVAYNNGDSWIEGVVEDGSCIGAALVRWRVSIHSMENETWFEMPDLAPVIQNEAYLAHDDDLLEAGKSGLLQNDTIEPRPRKIENVLYETDDSEPDVFSSQVSVRNGDTEPFYHVLDGNQPPQHRIPLTSLAYDTIPENNVIGKKRHLSTKSPRSSRTHTLDKKSSRRSQPSPPHIYDHTHHTLPHAHTHPHAHTLPHAHSYFPPPFVAGPWGMYETLPYNSYMYPPQRQMPPYAYPPQRPISPVRLPPNRTLEHTSLPVAWSYTTDYHNNGIQPHASSSFFSQMWGKFSAPVRNRSKVMPRKMSNPGDKNMGILKKSPSNISKAASEPVYGGGLPAHLSTVETLPRKDVSSKSLLSWKRKKETSHKQKKEISASLEEQFLEENEPQPYEVPLESLNIYDEIDGADVSVEMGKTGGKKEKKKKEKSPPKNKSTKGKSADKDSARALTIASSSPPEVSVTNGGSTLFTCLASAGSKVTYQWSKDGATLPSKAHSNAVVTAPGILEVQKCTAEDEGLYTCTVSNKWGTSSRTFSLTIPKGIPRSSSKPSGFPSSPQIALPAGVEGRLDSSFNNKVTYAELNMPPQGVLSTPQNMPPQRVLSTPQNMPPQGAPPTPQGTDGSYELETVQAFLDNLVEEMHISDDEFNTELFDKDPLSERPLGDGREDDSAHPLHGEETDVVPPLPTILVTESKSMRIKHKRMSNPIKDDNQDYLEGYGANYGAVSSTTDLEKERLPKYAEKDIAKKLKQKRKVSEESEKSPKKAKKKFGLFSRSKKMVEDKTQADVIIDYKEIPSPTKSTVRFAEVLIEDDFTKRDSGLTDISLGVNTSLGSEHSEGSLVENGCGLERLELPTEEESISEQVRRLQVSVEEYNHEEMKDRKVKKSSRFGKLAKRTKS